MRKFYFLNLICIFLILGLKAGAQPNELLAHYLLDETDGMVAADASSNGYDGTVNGIASWVDGTLGGAFEFNGDSYITLPGVAIGLTSDIGSFACWMNADVPSGINTMFWAGDNTTGGGFGPENEMHVHLEEAGDYWAGGELSFWALANPNVHIYSDPDKGTSAATAPVNPTLLGDKEWHHIAATWGSGMLRLFCDGSLSMEGPYVSTSYALTDMFLGQMGGGARKYTGLLDDVRIYSGVLTDIEISDLYNKITNVKKITDNRNHLSIYPNPASDDLNVRFVSEPGKLAEVSLVNLVGQEVATLPVSTVGGVNDMTLSLDGITRGIYFVRLKLDNEVTVGKAMIK